MLSENYGEADLLQFNLAKIKLKENRPLQAGDSQLIMNKCKTESASVSEIK